jgi:hypothetical protein
MPSPATALPSHLRPDCQRCIALCCVAPAFDADQGFGYDKPAGEPCRHLQADHRCAIHSSLATHGYPSCAAFDCFGAGQRVTQQFGNSHWRDSAEVSSRMFQSYSRMRTLHELLALATLAQQHADNAATARRLQEILAGIEHLCEIDEPIDGVALRHRTLQHIRDALSLQGST